ncbi:YeeE/YedE family protein [Microbulbifer sp. OS29]|uniref:YeeE/YedE family protein n=1 Tax=Microbulbifer okhotskensis TaxID=2926617 RepID=A0A9X2EQE0_9GAMM|nr:YeeE/YedE family protein [Microbulbifer okhotskensis]MCO1336467.1 YeeE/YedE family protein [Microbulbifer okhotskensis]
MTIDWIAFTPTTALAGGALIGLASALLLAFNGRIAGISGVIGGLIERRPDSSWRLAFIAGLLIGPLVWQIFATLPATKIEANYFTLITAGLLVGFGTRLASGCTSGHGVCGLSRLSVRSLGATTIFMAAGFATVFVMRHLLMG